MKKRVILCASLALMALSVSAQAICTADVALKGKTSADFKKFMDEAVKEAFIAVGGDAEAITTALEAGKLVKINFSTMTASAGNYAYHTTLCYTDQPDFYNCKHPKAADNKKEFEKLLESRELTTSQVTFSSKYLAAYKGGVGTSFGDFYTLTLNPDRIACNSSRSEDDAGSCSSKLHISFAYDDTPLNVASLARVEQDRIEQRRTDFAAHVRRAVEKKKVLLVNPKCK